MNKETKNILYDAVGGFLILCFAAVVLGGSLKLKNLEEQKEREAKVEAYRKTLPNYADSLVMFVDKNEKIIRGLADSVNSLPAGPQRDGVARRLGFMDAMFDEFAKKQTEVDLQVARYCDSLMNAKKR